MEIHSNSPKLYYGFKPNELYFHENKLILLLRYYSVKNLGIIRNVISG